MIFPSILLKANAIFNWLDLVVGKVKAFKEACLLESPTKQFKAGIKSLVVLVCQEKPSAFPGAPVNVNVVLCGGVREQSHFCARCWGKPAPGCAWVCVRAGCARSLSG